MHFLQVAPEESDGQSMFELKRQMVDLKALISALPAMILELLHPRPPTEPASGSHTLPSEPASGFVETNITTLSVGDSATYSYINEVLISSAKVAVIVRGYLTLLVLVCFSCFLVIRVYDLK